MLSDFANFLMKGCKSRRCRRFLFFFPFPHQPVIILSFWYWGLIAWPVKQAHLHCVFNLHLENIAPQLKEILSEYSQSIFFHFPTKARILYEWQIYSKQLSDHQIYYQLLLPWWESHTPQNMIGLVFDSLFKREPIQPQEGALCPQKRITCIKYHIVFDLQNQIVSSLG